MDESSREETCHGQREKESADFGSIFPNFKGQTALGKVKIIVRTVSGKEDKSSKYQNFASEENENKRKCKELLESF